MNPAFLRANEIARAQNRAKARKEFLFAGLDDLPRHCGFDFLESLNSTILPGKYHGPKRCLYSLETRNDCTISAAR